MSLEIRENPTPGPWRLAWGKVVDQDDKAICMLTPRKNAWNGDLLAAAPDLLSALRFLLADYVAIEGEKLTGSSVPLAMAREAIAKAEGGSR